jgi:hypothetical protein
MKPPGYPGRINEISEDAEVGTLAGTNAGALGPETSRPKLKRSRHVWLKN